MAQLPPKVPSMAPNWPCFPHQRLPPDTITPNPTTANHHQQEQPCWMDEFLDFSAVKRGSHRRSASDSIAFLDAPLVEECRHQHMMNGGFDRLDDEQLMSMFSDDINIPMTVPPSLSSSNPSTPSDQNSNNEEKPTPMELQLHPKPEPGEVESSCKTEPQQSLTTQPSAAATNDTVFDPKRVKRILANRQSAQRSRVRKLQYISELERSVTTLQSEVSVLSPRVAFLDHQRLILNVDNSALKQRIAALAQDKIFKEAHQEALRNEIERLRQVYHQKMRTSNDNAQPNSETMGCTGNEMLPNLAE